MTSTVRRFLSLLCGEYSNQKQAFENPPLYSHIFLRYRPLEHLIQGQFFSSRLTRSIRRIPTGYA